MFVRTVLGDIDPLSLGPTYCHEHLLSRPAERFGVDLVLDDEERAAAELASFRDVGGRSLVDATTEELGRNPAGLERLAQRSGINLIATTGHISEEYWHEEVDVGRRSEAELVQELIRELTEGIGNTSVRAGIIKVGTSLDFITEAEHRIIRAAGIAQRATGAPITTHTTAGTAAVDQLRALEKAGADLQRVCVGHLDRRLIWEEHLGVARTGAFLGFDQISKEQYEPDADRVRFIVRLADEGFAGRLCLSGDLARRSYLMAWGGSPGYRYLLEEFLPRLVEEGLEERQARALVVDNPASLLTWRA